MSSVASWTAITSVAITDFLKAKNELILNGKFNSQIYKITKFLIFGKIPWAIIYIAQGTLPKMGQKMNIPTERATFKLSESHKSLKLGNRN